MSSVKTAKEREAGETGELIALLTEQRNLYAELAALAQRQQSLITGDDPERLLEVLGQRQRAIDRLGVLADRLRPHLDNWGEVRPLMPETDGRRADGLVTEINKLLSTILARDKADAELLAARKGSTAAAVAGLKRGKQAGAAYAANAGTGQSRVDWTDQ